MLNSQPTSSEIADQLASGIADQLASRIAASDSLLALVVAY